MPRALSRGAEIALQLDTIECLARVLTAPQRMALRAAEKYGCVEAHMWRRRMCEQLEAIGLLSKSSFNTYALTGRGAQVLQVFAVRFTGCVRQPDKHG
jgi:hypothetical protein